MENQNQQNQPQPSEVDLGQVFARVGEFFTNTIFFGITRFLAVLRNTPVKHKGLFTALVVLGGAFGFLYSFSLKKKFYDSTMILSSDYLNKRIIDSSIEKLNLLAEEESPTGLAHALKVSDSLAKNIDKFDAKPFVSEVEVVELEVLKEQIKSAQLKNQDIADKLIRKIQIENQHAFEFTIRTYSPTAIRPLQDALVNYFKNNDYIKKRIQINRSNLVARKEKLQRDSGKLDSLKKVIYSNYKTMAEQSRQGSNNVILSDKAVTNPVEIYTQDLYLYNQLQQVERDVFLQPDFEVVDGFTEFSEPASAGRTKIIVTAMLIGFAFGYVVIAMREFNKYLSTIS
jgi:hypothetical protein